MTDLPRRQLSRQLQRSSNTDRISPSRTFHWFDISDGVLLDTYVSNLLATWGEKNLEQKLQ